MKVDAINRYSISMFYSYVNGKKVLKKSENVKDKNNEKNNLKTYKPDGINEFENKGLYLDLYV